MSNDIRFSDAQVEQLTELFKTSCNEIREGFRKSLRFENSQNVESRDRVTSFNSLKEHINQRFIEQRSFIRQIMRDEVKNVLQR